MKVAVFGRPGGGKSTLSQKVAAAVNLPLHQLDLIKLKTGGAKVADEDFVRQHTEILAQHQRVLDGFGTPQSSRQRCVRRMCSSTSRERC